MHKVADWLTSPLCAACGAVISRVNYRVNNNLVNELHSITKHVTKYVSGHKELELDHLALQCGRREGRREEQAEQGEVWTGREGEGARGKEQGARGGSAHFYPTHEEAGLFPCSHY